MTKKSAKRVLTALLAVLLLAAVVLPVSSLAYEWWIMETVYTVTGRAPVTEAGPQSRIFLPAMTIETIDGIEMDASFTVLKDGETFTSGDYAEGVYVDLNGAGVYDFIVKGVDAKNDYTFTVNAAEDAPSLIAEGELPLSVSISDPFEAPAAQIAKGSETKEAEISLQMANGAIYCYDGNAVPEAGLMTVIYSAVFEDKAESFSFEVTVCDDRLGFYDEYDNFYPAGVTPLEDQDMTGALLNGDTGKTYTFSQTIDVSQATKNDPLIILNNGSEDCTNAVPLIRIIDANNPQNYIEILGRASTDNANMVYTVANAPGQAKVGHLGGTSYYNQSIFGTETTFARSCTVSRNTPAIYYYDNEEKAVYANWYGSINLIADFDADYQIKKWEGFSTGEVYIAVIRQRDNDYFCVQSVAGQSLAQGAGNEDAPVLSVASDAYDTVPYGISGKTYPIFAATAIDELESQCDVSVHVYKGYDVDFGIEVNVTDNCFIPYEAGYYTIVYSASDSFGNGVQRKVNVPVYAESEVPAVTADITGIPTEAFVGDKIVLPEAKNIQGGSGAMSCAVYLVSDGNTTAVEDDYVILPDAATNTIRYVFTDYIGEEHVLAYDIRCTKSDAPILYQLSMPETLPTGKNFTLPAAEYAEDDTVTVDITAAVDGTAIEVADNTITPVTENPQAELTVTYTAKNGAGKTSSKTYSIALLGGSTADRTSYFLPVSGTVEKTQADSSIRFATADSDAKIRFTSSVLADKFSVTMKVDGEQNDSDRLTVTVSDAMDASVSVRFDIVKKADADVNGTSEFYINGVQVNDTIGNFYGGVENFGITYKPSTLSVVDAAGNALGTITTTQAGKSFTGFPSGEVNVVFSTGTVGEKGFAFEVLQLNNQAFAGDSMFFDNYPEIMINGTMQLQAELGETIQIPTASGADVLSPNVSLYLTIRKGMDVVQDNLPLDEIYSLTLDEYATYYIIYNYSEGDVVRSATYPVQVMEHTAPRVEEPDLPMTAKQGEKVTIPTVTATDDYSATVTVSVILEAPNACMTNVSPEDMSFTAEQTGTYTVYYYIYDECWNYQILSYEITVK